MNRNVLQNMRIMGGLIIIGAILFSAAFYIHWTAERSIILFPKASGTFKEEYQQNHKLSYLLESAIINPDKDNLRAVEEILLVEGEYKLAETLDSLIKNPKFYLKASETALLNLDYDKWEEYSKQVHDGQEIEELRAFRDALNGNWGEIELEPVTNVGKLLRMIETADYSQYRINNPLGDRIYSINQTTAGRVANTLAQTANFYENGYYFLALEALKKDPGYCTRDYFLLKSDIYNSKENYDQALKFTEEGLGCNPADQIFISRAIEYNTRLGNTSQTEFYKQRLNALVDTK